MFIYIIVISIILNNVCILKYSLLWYTADQKFKKIFPVMFSVERIPVHVAILINACIH